VRHKTLCGFMSLLALMWFTPVHAANNDSIPALSPTPQFDMGSTAQSVTFTVNNTSSAGERIYIMRFRINSGSTFNAATAAPAGWTRTAFTATSVTFQATDWTTSILAGSNMAFTLQLNLRITSPDVTETLRDARATFTLDTNFGNGITSNGTRTINTPGSWTLKSLQITSFQTTDTSGTPVSAMAAGTSFRVVITVKNISNATQSNIVANPSPPTQTRTGTWFSPAGNCSLTSTSPSPLTLAAAASGTMTYTCTTLATDNGTVFFTANVRNGTSTATSRSGNSNVLTVSSVTVAWRPITPAPPSCLFSGNTATMTLRVTNSTAVTITSVAPSGFTLTSANGASTSALTGPAPASVASLAPAAFQDFVWTVVATGTVPVPPTTAPNITVSAAATYTSGATVTTPATSSTKFVDDYVVNINPTSSNASSANQELTWTVTNRGCANVNSVAITVIPAGWTFGDGYSVVADMTGTDQDNWTLAATTFTAPNAAGRTPKSVSPTFYDGNYSLLFSATPATTGPSTFTVRVTDDNGAFVDHTTPVTVNAFDPTGPNLTNPSTLREIFQ
jgi:hypothetical protein